MAHDERADVLWRRLPVERELLGELLDQARERRRTISRLRIAQASLEKPPASATDTVKQGVSKGMDKLKGLFGR